MPPKFGTSGLRGLVTELTEGLVRDYTQAFLAACAADAPLFVGQDLRPSSPEIAGWVMEAAQQAGLDVRDCGALPTPALALAAKGALAVMVTGSHIPADRNGLKFYVPSGEISKDDETRITAHLGQGAQPRAGGARSAHDAITPYVARYAQAFGGALTGLRIGVYQHSSVARDVMVDVMAALGADPVPIARSDVFIPVDTEALDPATQALFSGWIAEHDLDALISTDGDADRPMMVGASGRVIPGDVLGALTARSLGARQVCTPISSNTQVDQMFTDVRRTRIGSPHVIAAMEEAISESNKAKTVGYEANGGFLLGFAVEGLDPLMTRDSLLPIIAPLAAAQRAGQTLEAMVAKLPARFTAADRLQGIPTETSAAFLAGLKADAAARATFFEGVGAEMSVDHTDGLRVTFAGGEIIHLRPSGNAPEFRCYTEAESETHAAELLAWHLSALKARLTN